MIHTCQNCGAWFPAKDLDRALKENATTITCNYCGMTTEIREMHSSHTAKGFDYLSLGDFYRATYSFSTAIDDAKKHQHHPSVDAYLGYALAQYRVQTVFSDDDSERDRVPELIYHKCNEMYFADSDAFMNAERSVREELAFEKDAMDVELYKLEKYKNSIDALKDAYDAIARKKGADFSYGAFIAYEDEDLDSMSGFETAHKVRNALPDKVKNIFLPDREEYSSDIEYEAAILYAIEHSKCMLVITDNNIDSRLKNIYSRFFFNSRSHNALGVNNLAFIRYRGHITIALPDKSVAEKNVFDIDDKSAYIDFVYAHNNILGGTAISPAKDSEAKDSFTFIDPIYLSDIEVEEGDFSPQFLSGNQIAFGMYPQRRERSVEIENYFASLPKPTISDDKGWTVLEISKRGKPYTWYRDEEIHGKMYRGVYFMKFRDVYSVQDSNIPAREQRGHGYMPMRVYCFAFEPLIWNIEEMSHGMAVLVANQGLDSRAFNKNTLSNAWYGSSMHEWLNGEFLNVAFTPEQQKYLCMLDGGEETDRIYLMDKVFDKEFYHDNRKAILGSDYFKCIGGMGERVINSFWITANDNDKPSEASVIYPSMKNGLAHQYVDCTNVAVLPKIILKLS